MIEGYSVEDAARLLGIPEGRVWELVARGVLAGSQGPGGDWRVQLTGQASESIAARRATEPQGHVPPAPDQGEASPFRELLAEFRNLTERYGQALLALGEARGEVAALRSRVDALETRIDLRLPSSSPAAGAGPAAGWQASAASHPPGVAGSATRPRDVDSQHDEVAPASWAPATELDAPEALPPQASPDAGHSAVDSPSAARPAEAPPSGGPAESPPSGDVPDSEHAAVSQQDADQPVAGGPAAIQPHADQPEEPPPSLAEEPRPRRRAQARHSALAGLADAFARAEDPALDLHLSSAIEPARDPAVPAAEPVAERAESAPSAAEPTTEDAAAEEVELMWLEPAMESDPEAGVEPDADEDPELGGDLGPAGEVEPEPQTGAGQGTELEPAPEEDAAAELEIAISGGRQSPDADQLPHIHLPEQWPAVDEQLDAAPVMDLGDDPYPDQAEMTDDEIRYGFLASELPDDVEPFELPDELESLEPVDAITGGDKPELGSAPFSAGRAAPALEPPEWLQDDATSPADAEPDGAAREPADAEPDGAQVAPEARFAPDAERTLPGADELRSALQALTASGRDTASSWPASDLSAEPPSPPSAIAPSPAQPAADELDWRHKRRGPTANAFRRLRRLFP